MGEMSEMDGLQLSSLKQLECLLYSCFLKSDRLSAAAFSTVLPCGSFPLWAGYLGNAGLESGWLTLTGSRGAEVGIGPGLGEPAVLRRHVFGGEDRLSVRGDISREDAVSLEGKRIKH